MSRTYAIGDLHGRFDLLCRAIDVIEADAGDDGGTFICLGDFVDRGPQARCIVDLLMAGPQRASWRWIVLQGNHEAIMLEVLADPTPSNMGWWIRNGGGATLASYGYAQGDRLLPLKVPAEHVAWLEALPVWHEDDRRIFVHAGVPHDVPVADATRQTLQWMLYRGEIDYADAQVELDAGHCSGKHIVHGHEQSETQPLMLPHHTNLDSFAWLSGRAAIGVFDDTQAGPVRILAASGRVA